MYYQNWGGKMPLYFWWVMVPLIIWDLLWRGIALYRSARSSQKGWFIALLIVNSAGILPILYLAFFQKKRK